MTVYESGGCEIDLTRREVRARGIPVPLGGRAFEILEALVRSAGELVTKIDLMDRVWSGVAVEENTLQVHISAVRKALGPYRSLLKTEPGRGYRLLGTWSARGEPAAGAPAPPLRMETGPLPRAPARPSASNFPVAASELIGRGGAVQQLLDLLSAYRVVTLTGPGGIGKTTLALEVARKLLPDFDGDGWVVELATLSNPDLVPATAASVLGLGLPGERIAVDDVARAIGSRRLILVLDNCEHVVDAAADLAETIVRLCAHATLLATSREVLRIEGEYVYRVPPLAVPTQQADEANDLLEHSAVELFIARTRALDSGFSPDAESLPAIAAICRQLDGIPLAIEFAAARTATLGPAEVAARLNDRFALLTGGRRTALPRHQTLRAALDWSYELLPEDEQCLLRYLAIFAGGFTLDGAVFVTRGTSAAASGTIEKIANLVGKSLVIFDGSTALGRWRLLETIRAYALDKLRAGNELEDAARRHAEYHRDLFARARSDWESQPTATWVAEYGFRLADLRATLDWAFAQGGDADLGMRLTVDAVPLWMQNSLMGECRRRVEQALQHLPADAREHTRLHMRLQTALSLSRMYTGEPLSEMNAAWSATLDIAERVGDPDYQLRAIWALFAVRFNSGAFRDALGFAEQFCRVAPDPAGQLIGERLAGTALHILGDQHNARRRIERMLSGYPAPVTSSHLIRYQNEQVIAAHRVLASILWLQGYPDQAMRMARDAVTDALTVNHALTLCNLLAQSACPLAFLVGDVATAHAFTALLVDRATRHSLAVWHTYGRCFEGVLLIREGHTADGLSVLHEVGAEQRQSGFLQFYTPYLGFLAEAFAAIGDAERGLAAIDEALERAAAIEERWCFAELLRLKGELLQHDAGALAAAEDCFSAAIRVAREQEVLSWELRAGLSLARLRASRGDEAAARQTLAPIYDRFTEGFATADLRAARDLLDTLST